MAPSKMDDAAEQAGQAIMDALSELHPADQLVVAASVFLNTLHQHLDRSQVDAVRRALLTNYTQRVYACAAALEAAETVEARRNIAAFHSIPEDEAPRA